MLGSVVLEKVMLVPLGTVTALMVVMAAKHFCADFLFQTSWIARGKAATERWLLPLLVHAFAHAILTLLVAIVLFPRLWWIAPIELVLHAAIDRAKVIFGRRARLDPTKTEYWWLFGFDQFLHHLTNILIVFVFLSYGQ
jgi:hypothetical protein